MSYSTDSRRINNSRHISRLWQRLLHRHGSVSKLHWVQRIRN